MRGWALATVLHFGGWVAVVGWVLSRPVAAPPELPRHLRVEHLDVVDGQGRVVASLGSFGDGSTLRMSDGVGSSWVLLSARSERAEVFLGTEEETASLSVGPPAAGLHLRVERPAMAWSVESP